jgi:L,D-peptidoglycan transpeptidase YkuD (ErfK/YbiS/YcfS/YnhG family)
LIDLVTIRCENGRYIANWGVGAGQCSVGRGGIGVKEKEGDGITPVGTWPLRGVLYRAERQPALKTELSHSIIAPNDGWCDAAEDENYNLPVKLPYPASAEALWRDDGLYDIVVVIGFNDAPVVLGKGSAIFLHVAANNFANTEGCVALKKKDLVNLLSVISHSAKIRIE